MRNYFAALVLSIVVLPLTVKAQEKNLSSVNHEKTDAKSSSSRLAKRGSDIPELVRYLLAHGEDANVEEGFAPMIGFQHSMPLKGHETTTHERECGVVYDVSRDSSTSSGMHPICIYMIRRHFANMKMHSDVFRMDLKGHLEKAAILDGDTDANGEAIPSSSVPTDQDIHSPLIKKKLDAEIAYWLKDWLKTEQKAAK